MRKSRKNQQQLPYVGALERQGKGLLWHAHAQTRVRTHGMVSEGGGRAKGMGKKAMVGRLGKKDMAEALRDIFLAPVSWTILRCA